jgi:hypothetical protein
MKRSAAVLVALTLALAAEGVLASLARADGDPASDVLLVENVFYPYGQPVSPALRKTLDGETAALSHTSFPLRVALISSPLDLGSYPHVFAKPKLYAQLLGEELNFFGSRKIVLVVMANGYGVHGVGEAVTRAATALARPSGGRSDDLARAAIAAVRTLASAAGQPIKRLSGAHAAKPAGGPTVLALVILALASGAVAGSVLFVRSRRS